jgi:hypothetical protein
MIPGWTVTLGREALKLTMVFMPRVERMVSQLSAMWLKLK